MRQSCENYYQIKIPYRYEKTKINFNLYESKITKVEVIHLRDVSIEGNNYPPHLVNNIIKHESGKQARSFYRY